MKSGVVDEYTEGKERENGNNSGKNPVNSINNRKEPGAQLVNRGALVLFLISRKDAENFAKKAF